jgi:hypothetical protein
MIFSAGRIPAAELLGRMGELRGFCYYRWSVPHLVRSYGMVLRRMAYPPRFCAFSRSCGTGPQVSPLRRLDRLNAQVEQLAVRCRLPHPGLPVRHEKPVGSDVRPPVAQEFRRADVFLLHSAAGGVLRTRRQKIDIVQGTLSGDRVSPVRQLLWAVVSENSVA